MYKSEDLMEVIRGYHTYDVTMDKFCKRHYGYSYEISLIPGDYLHKIQVIITHDGEGDIEEFGY